MTTQHLTSESQDRLTSLRRAAKCSEKAERRIRAIPQFPFYNLDSLHYKKWFRFWKRTEARASAASASLHAFEREILQ